jgi:hypothetical protein
MGEYILDRKRACVNIYVFILCYNLVLIHTHAESISVIRIDMYVTETHRLFRVASENVSRAHGVRHDEL